MLSHPELVEVIKAPVPRRLPMQIAKLRDVDPEWWAFWMNAIPLEALDDFVRRHPEYAKAWKAHRAGLQRQGYWVLDPADRTALR